MPGCYILNVWTSFRLHPAAWAPFANVGILHPGSEGAAAALVRSHHIIARHVTSRQLTSPMPHETKVREEVVSPTSTSIPTRTMPWMGSLLKCVSVAIVGGSLGAGYATLSSADLRPGVVGSAVAVNCFLATAGFMGIREGLMISEQRQSGSNSIRYSLATDAVAGAVVGCLVGALRGKHLLFAASRQW